MGYPNKQGVVIEGWTEHIQSEARLETSEGNANHGAQQKPDALQNAQIHAENVGTATKSNQEYPKAVR